MTDREALTESRLDHLQPSQLYISTEKLAAVLRDFDPARPEAMEAVPLKQLGDDLVMTDGHTRAFAAFLSGLQEIPTVWDEDELDWEAYRLCVRWCKEAGVRCVGDLVGRVLGPEDYERLWRGRCQKMHAGLAASRAEESG
jgi:hypothetical protein